MAPGPLEDLDPRVTLVKMDEKELMASQETLVHLVTEESLEKMEYLEFKEFRVKRVPLDYLALLDYLDTKDHLENRVTL